jgi:hypothetical protein
MAAKRTAKASSTPVSTSRMIEVFSISDSLAV